MSAALSKSNTLSELLNSEVYYEIIGAPVKDLNAFPEVAQEL